MGDGDDRDPQPDDTPDGDTPGEAGSTGESREHGYGSPEGYRDAQTSGDAQGPDAPEEPEVPWYDRPGAPGPYGPPAPDGPPDPYRPPGPHWVPTYRLVRPMNGLAIVSLVLGIIWVYWIGSILALVFGYAAKRQILESGEQGSGLATAGIVLGWVGVGTLTVMLAYICVATGGSVASS